MRKIVLLICILMLISCGQKPEKKVSDKIKVAIVLSSGGLGDKSFNDSAFRGLQLAKEKLGVEFDYREIYFPGDDEKYLREFAKKDYDLIIATGFLMKNACKVVSNEFPDKKFAIIDEIIEEENVKSIVFDEREGSFLAGVLAALVADNDKIGFIGGLETPLIKKFENGYVTGAKFVNPDIEVEIDYVNENPFANISLAKRKADKMYQNGVKIIFHAAGGSGLGVIKSAHLNSKYVIGVDSNQDAIARGYVLSSMLKNVDLAVYDTVKELKDGKFKGVKTVYGAKENGVGLTDFFYTKDVIGEENIKKLRVIENNLKNGRYKTLINKKD